jgi:hypothetical protein
VIRIAKPRGKRGPLNVSPVGSVRVLTRGETSTLIEQWKAEFFVWHKYSSSMFPWSSFTSEFGFPAIERVEAQAAYEAQVALEYTIISDDKVSGLATDVKPIEISHSDCVVFPANLAWTMAYTHETGMYGPYFAKHRDYEKLSLDNLTSLRRSKAKEVALERARSQQWT